MTDCAELMALVEKLADFEATAVEKLAAETHLEKCPRCRSHAEFLASLTEELKSMPFAEPPASYWEHLPRKVLDRIDSESRRPSGFFRILLAPSMLRWGALGATLLVAAAVGLSVLREDSRRTPAPAAASPAPVPEAREAEARVAAEPSAPPPMARDEVAPAAARQEIIPDAEEPERASEDSQALAPAAPAEAVANFESSEPVGPSLQKENVRLLESANRARPKAASGAALSRVVPEDCDAMRRALTSLDSREDGRDASDARFRLALCSLESHERKETDELRTRAIEDAEAFLAGEDEGARAEEIRGRLRRIKPN